MKPLKTLSNVLMFVSVTCLAQMSEKAGEQTQEEFKESFDSLCVAGDFESLLPLMKLWEREHSDDPEMYIGYFNYYLQKSKKEILQLDREPGPDKNLTLTQDDSDKPSGFLYSKIYYEPEVFKKAQSYLIDGLRKHRRRLDMYFGRIYSLRQAEYFEEHVSEILNVIKVHQKEPDGWLWSLNEPLDESEDFFRDAIQDYNYALFNLDEPRFEDVRKISLAMAELYPDDLKNYANIGSADLMKGDFDSAINHFMQALALDESDVLVLSNIAYSYIQKGDKKAAISFYERIVELGDDQSKKFAEHQIQQLQKN